MDRAAAAIRAGGVVALPTDTLYGLAADPFNADAVQRLFALKGRTVHHALPLIASDTTQITRQIGALSPAAQRLANRFWPGPLTLLVNLPERPPRLAEAVSAGTGRVGVRVPAHTVARALCDAAGTLLTATSANVSGQPPTDDPDAVATAIGGSIDILLDGGMTPGGAPSTVVDVTDVIDARGSGLRLIRAGAVSWDEVQACARLE
jgi:L-threonylcarbamoyladenylate synthase